MLAITHQRERMGKLLDPDTQYALKIHFVCIIIVSLVSKIYNCQYVGYIFQLNLYPVADNVPLVPSLIAVVTCTSCHKLDCFVLGNKSDMTRKQHG